MKVAVIQLCATADKKKNLQKASSFCRKGIRSKAKFILLPELFNYRGAAKDFSSIAELIPGESTRPLIELARKHKVTILAGSVYEKILGSKKVFNTSVLIDSRGKIAAKYRKTNLFDAVIGRKKIKESDRFAAGKQFVTAQIGEYKIGLSICYDLRFSKIYRYHAKKGAHILCVPSAFTKTTGRAHWEILLRARAIENLCYVLAPNQAGHPSKGTASYGNSMIVDPWGKILVRGPLNSEGVFYADIKMDEIKKARKILPSVC